MSLRDDVYILSPSGEENPVPRGEIVINLEPEKLLALYRNLPDILQQQGMGDIIHSVRISGLNRYARSIEPVSVYLNSNQWGVVQFAKQRLVKALDLAQSGYWESSLPGATRLGNGLYYAGLPTDAAKRFLEVQ